MVTTDGKVLLLTAKLVPVPWSKAPTVLPFVSITERFVERTSPAVGVKIIVTTQLVCWATDVPQLLVWEKSPVLGP